MNKFFFLMVLCLINSQNLSRLEASSSDNNYEGVHKASVNAQKQDTMKIKITIDGNILTATLNNSKAAKDFASLLPITLKLDDYAKTEKVSDLSKRLNTSDSPSGCDPDVGDITYYAPWGNLAIFYKDFGYAEGLIKLGEIKGDINLLQVAGSIEATFELVE